MASKKIVYIFDWDGTLVDSNTFKWHGAWQMTFEGEEDKQRFIQEVLNRPEIGKKYNRWQLVREVLVLAGITEVQDLEGEALHVHPEISFYVDRFSEILQNGLDHMQPFIKTKETLQRLHDSGHPVYVISNSAPANIQTAAHYFGLDTYINVVFGLPETKHQNFDMLQKVEPEGPYIVVGDGELDRGLAEYAGAFFVGICNEHNKWEPGIQGRKIYITSLAELPDDDFFLSTNI